MSKKIDTEISIYADSIMQRYKSALHAFYLFRNLQSTTVLEFTEKEIAERNNTFRNDLRWIMGESVEQIYMFMSVIFLYSIFESKDDKKTWKTLKWDTVSIYLVLDHIEHSTDSKVKKINVKSARKKFAFLDLKIKNDLKNLRHCIWHNFCDEKKNKKLYSLTIKNVEDMLLRVWKLLNEITLKTNRSMSLFDVFDKETADDYRRLFYFLDRQKKVSDLFLQQEKTDKEIMNELNKIYRPYLPIIQ